MAEPRRVQLKRSKGWRMPDNTRSVARPGPFGNPFTVADAREAGYTGSETRLQIFVVRAFRNWLAGDISGWMGPEADAARERILSGLPELRGKNLACWCKPGEACHADVLLELANETRGSLPETGWMIWKDTRGWYRPDAAGYTTTRRKPGGIHMLMPWPIPTLTESTGRATACRSSMKAT
ncbi:MAG: DUF4326 domain-containing protein [Rhizobiales bacterium]|nr:DUF4326 domain-containing protein [Hyphomicrobiales bacterium]